MIKIKGTAVPDLFFIPAPHAISSGIKCRNKEQT